MVGFVFDDLLRFLRALVNNVLHAAALAALMAKMIVLRANLSCITVALPLVEIHTWPQVFQHFEGSGFVGLRRFCDPWSFA